MQNSADVFIVGGGPAGLAFAISAAQGGLRVVVADHCRPPIDKACGEGLMPDTVQALNTLGIIFADGEGVPFRGIRFCDANGRASVQADFGKGFGVGLRRTALHAKLAQRAKQLGVTLLWGSRINYSDRKRIFCEGKPVQSKWVIGADGEASRFRKWAGFEATRYEHIRFSTRQHFQIAPWSDFAEVYWARGCQVVVAAVASDEVCVAATSRNPLLRFHEAVSEIPALVRRLRGVNPTNPVRGTRAPFRRLRRVCHGRFALIGDASGSVDPLTGEGIGLAFKQGAALANAITRGDLQSYQAAHNSFCRVPRLISRLMLMMDAYPHLRDRALRMLAAEPSLFSRLLNVNVGNLTLLDFGLPHALRLGWRIVSPPWEL
ncbi:MAG TPA: NAD(P)/FAD-dependent oxidoreductase [Candidatus Acidoferrales bacterium]|jgi:flavin-dependent dehydrogenase|nr:NAD(P)/FAD-dependent oxidoreductase [Candidatus Acidoferrales bacterium]